MSETIPPSGEYEKTLEEIKQNLESAIDGTKVLDYSQYQYIFDDPNKVKKQTDAQYEIFISLTANVLENVDNSVFPESKHIASNNYYIPVPSGQDHNEYLKAFFQYLESCMGASAEKAHNEEVK